MILLPITKDSEWAWFKAQTSTIMCEDTQGLVVYGDTDEIQAMAVFDSFTVDSCTVHWAVANPMVLRNGFLQEIARHLFVTCGRTRIFGLVPSNNEKALKFDLHVGMREVARIPDAVRTGVDYIVLCMTKQECRWLPDDIREAA